VEEDWPMIRDRRHLQAALSEVGEHARREEEAVEEGGSAMVGEGEGMSRGVEVTKSITEEEGRGETPHGCGRLVVAMSSHPRQLRPPLLLPIHGEVEIPPDDAVPTHPRQERMETLLYEEFLPQRVTRREVRVDEEKGVTGPEATKVEEASIRCPCDSSCPSHDAEEPIGQPVLPNEGGDPSEGAIRIAGPIDLIPRPSEGFCSSCKTVLHPCPRRCIAIPYFCFLN
jgi:hypothetical protein